MVVYPITAKVFADLHKIYFSYSSIVTIIEKQYRFQVVNREISEYFKLHLTVLIYEKVVIITSKGSQIKSVYTKKVWKL